MPFRNVDRQVILDWISEYSGWVEEAEIPSIYESFFEGVVLYGEDLRGYCLKYINFNNADLGEVDLCGVDLTGASFKGANLRNANLSEA